MKKVAELLQLTTNAATKDLTKDVVFRQEMAQPLAVSMRHWWKAFKDSRQLADIVPSPPSPPKAPEETHQARTFRVATAYG